MNQYSKKQRRRCILLNNTAHKVYLQVKDRKQSFSSFLNKLLTDYGSKSEVDLLEAELQILTEQRDREMNQYQEKMLELSAEVARLKRKEARNSQQTA